MKVRVRSQSLWFTVLSIILHVPISRVKRKVNTLQRKPVAHVETERESKYWNRVAL
jgi:hypothetical protein